MSHPPQPPAWQPHAQPHPHPGPAHPPWPAARWQANVAAVLDQLAIAAFFLFWFGLASLAGDRAGGSTGIVVAAILTAIFGTTLFVLVESVIGSRRGATVGLFVMGLRFRPDGGDGVLEVLEYFCDFWTYLVWWPVIAPLNWLLDTVFGRPRTSPEDVGVVRDPRLRSAGAVILRLVVVVMIAASPLPVLLALS